MNWQFWISECIQFTTYGVIAYLCGLLVQLKNAKVNYTRKINFFALYLTPLVLARVFPFTQTLATTAMRSLLAAGIFMALVKPVRERVPLFATMFCSFDRPEDRPYTLFWLSTQILAGYFVLIPMSVVFARYGISELVFIPVVVHCVGDGFAEPVGVRFGRHKYTTRVFLSTAHRYTRSYEGSACVLIAGLFTVVVFYYSFTRAEFIGALLIVPLVMTLAEAWSPHTWDTPYMFFTGGASLLLVKLVL